MERGEQRPLTPNDIKQQTSLLRQNVTRGLVELENAGLAHREAPDGGALRKGQVLIYSWAVPRQPKEQDCNRARLQFPDWFPESWEPLKPIISRFKYNSIVDEAIARDYIEEGAEVARAYKKAEIVTARFLEKVCARIQSPDASLYRKNRKNIERKNASSSAVVPVLLAVKAEEDSSLYQKFKAQYPADRYDEAKAKRFFDSQTPTQQAHLLERLALYLTCDRWKDEDGRWIPLASNWLPTCDADPPPVIKKRAASAKKGFAESVMEEAQRRFNNGTL